MVGGEGPGDERGLEALVCDLYRLSHFGNVGDWTKLPASAEAAGRLAKVLPSAVDAVKAERSGLRASPVSVLAAARRVGEAGAVLARLSEAAWKRAALQLAAAAEPTWPELAAATRGRVASGWRAKRTKPARVELASGEARGRALAAGVTREGEPGPT